MSKLTYSIVLPCYNEADNIPILIERFKKFHGKYSFELLLVNNGSTDHSAEVMRKAEKESGNEFLRIIHIENNVGYGHGIQTGLSHAQGSILSYSHADFQTPPEDIFKAFDLIENQKFNLDRTIIKGFRINRSDDKTFLTQGLSHTVNLLLGKKLNDINGQPKVFSREFFESFEKPPTDFSYDVFVLYTASMKQMNLATFDVDFNERLHGESKWTTDIWQKNRTILKYLRSIFLLSWGNRSHSENPIKQLSQFFLIGILNYLIFFALLKGSSVGYLVSSVMGCLIGVGLMFLVYLYNINKESCKKIQQQILIFFLVGLVSLGISVATISIGENLGVIPEIGQIMAIAMSIISFLIGTRFVSYPVISEL